MATRKSRQRLQFRGIARYLWIAVGVLSAGLLINAWISPPPEGFAAYTRRMIGTLLVCFVCLPFVASGLVSMVGWLVNKDGDEFED